MSSELNSGPAQNSVPNTQNEVVQRMACGLCRRRKLRCDRQLPCDSCIRLNFECTYESQKNVPIVRKQSGDRTERKQALHRAFQGRAPESRTRNAPKRSVSSGVNSDWNPDQMTPEEMTEVEHQFFNTIHLSIPILHQERYFLGIESEPRLRPPNYLRHIVCALGASVAAKNPAIHAALYRSARRMLEETEYHDSPVQTASLARPEAWLLIAQYEMLQMQFQRWPISTARAVRLCQIMGLHVVDAVRPMQRNVARAKDWVELEEQRRIFWSSFVLDRYASFGQGCPMIIDEKDIHCFLPSSEEAYQSGTEEQSVTLSQALSIADPSSLTPLAAAISLTAETGHKLKLLQQNDFTAPASSPSGDIWQKINFLNDTLHYAFSIPPHLAASGFKHTPMLTFLHMAAPSSTISLHQAAEGMASAHGITPSSLLESQALRLAAAEMIASTMRLASHIDTRKLHPFTGACLFQASRVFMISLQVRTDEARKESLRVLLGAMSQLQAVNPLTGGYFKELDKEFPGMRQSIVREKEGVLQESPKQELSRQSSMSDMQRDVVSRASSATFEGSPSEYELGLESLNYPIDHHTALEQLRAPTSDPAVPSMTNYTRYQIQHSKVPSYTDWDSPRHSSDNGSVTAEYQLSDAGMTSSGSVDQNIDNTYTIQQPIAYFSDGGFYVE